MQQRPKRRSIATRACDRCRVRRAKCTAAFPSCARCVALGEVCAYSTPTKKRGPRPRSRIQPRRSSPPSDAPQYADLSVDLTLSRPSLAPSPALPLAFTPCVEYRPAATPGPSFVQVWTHLHSTFPALWRGANISAHFTTCVDAYMRYLFPITPLVDERVLRCVAACISSDLDRDPALRTDDLGEGSNTRGGSLDALTHAALPFDSLAVERSLTLLTALAATVASLCPASLLSHDIKASASSLLHASRQMLYTFEDLDVERPCATSVVIRYFHSLCAHASGQLRVSWYLLGDAIRIAQDLRVYDEASLVELPPQEAHLRRSVFWQLVTGDRSAAILNEMPFAFSASNFGTPFTTVSMLVDHDILLDESQLRDNEQLSRMVNTGFNAIAAIFERVVHLLLALRLLASTTDGMESSCVHRASITEHLGRLHGDVDELPVWLQRPWASAAFHGRTWREMDSSSCYIWILYANVMLTYHCLQLILLRRAIALGVTDTLGYSSDASLLALHTLRIAQCALQVMRSSPFEALQVNGEPSVEKIRQIGAVLLELVEKAVSEETRTRARTYFEEVMVLLTRLDSKASDTLWRRMNLV